MTRSLIYTAAFALAAGACALGASPHMALPPQPHVRPAGMPAGYVMVSPCIRTMGEHWANPSNMNAPIYGTWHGRIVFTEMMWPLTQLRRGVSYANLRALPGYHIDHIDFEFEPHGHEGMEVPHYDLHAYYVSPAQEARICPNGLPDPAMRPTNY
ncbi:MAG: hypothetical protein ACREMP_09435 [Candidatus Tyrphobacter sp.]